MGRAVADVDDRVGQPVGGAQCVRQQDLRRADLDQGRRQLGVQVGGREERSHAERGDADEHDQQQARARRLGPADGIVRLLTKSAWTARVLARGEVKEKFLLNGTEVVANSPDQFSAAIKSEVARLGKVMKDAGIRPE